VIRNGLVALPPHLIRGETHRGTPRPVQPVELVPSHTRAKESPPIDDVAGSTTVRAAAMATAASTAFPPSRSTSRPVRAAKGWLVATTPFVANTGWLRPGVEIEVHATVGSMAPVPCRRGGVIAT